jgi:hypothetical protein
MLLVGIRVHELLSMFIETYNTLHIFTFKICGLHNFYASSWAIYTVFPVTHIQIYKLVGVKTGRVLTLNKCTEVVRDAS